MDAIRISGAREAAFAALMACERQGAWSDQAIRSASRKFELSARDAALAANLCYGVVQNRLLLDFWIGAFSSTAPDRLDPEVRQSLRLGLYQLRFLDRVPASAAVNEAVSLVRKYGKHRGAAGLVNAVLRAFQRAKAPPMPSHGDRVHSLSLLYSHPQPLVELLEAELGGDVEPLLHIHNTPAEMVIQVNSLRTSVSGLQSELERCGVDAQPHPWLEGCLLVRRSGDLERLDAFRKGWFYVQDAAARLAVIAAAPKPGDKVLDACAAPGGKSFACGIQMGDRGDVLSCDLHENKLRRIRSGATRLGLECIHTAARDARVHRAEQDSAFDVVLADVPCSGLGIIRKKPDIRYKDLRETESLPAIQLDILNGVSRYVRPGGTLVYSTCTVLGRENGDVVRTFLASHGEYCLEPFTLPGPVGETDGQITLWPHIHGTDGFFIAKLRRANG